MGDAIRGAYTCAVLATLLALPALGAPDMGKARSAPLEQHVRLAAASQARPPERGHSAVPLASVVQAANPAEARTRIRSRLSEPAAFALIGSALVALGMVRRRRQV